MVLRLANWVIRLRWLILAGWLALAAGLAIFVPTTDPSANEQLTFLPSDCPSVQAAEAMSRHFPDSAGLSRAVIVIERRGPPGQLRAEDLAALDALVAELRRPLPQRLAKCLPTASLTGRCPGDLKLLRPNPLVSPDRSAAVAVIEVPANFVTLRSARVVDYVRQRVEAARPSLPDGLEIAVTGSAAFGRDYAAAAQRSHERTIWVTVVAVLVILLVVFRAPLAAGAVLGTISLAAVVAHLVLAVGASMGLHVGTAERIFVYVLLYGVGVDYSLLYLARFREMLPTASGPRAAAAAAWAATAPAIGASAGTDIAGLAMLAVASFGIFRNTGYVVPIALLIALAAALTLMPAAVAILHRRLFWPVSHRRAIGERFWRRVADVVTQRPWSVLLVTVGVLAIPAVWGARLNYVYDTLTGLGPKYGAVRGMEMSRRHWPIGHTTPTAVLIEAAGNPARLDAVATARALTAAIEAVPGVADVRSLTQPVGRDGKNLYNRLLLKTPNARLEAARAHLAKDDRAMRLEVVLTAGGFSNEAMASLADVQRAVRSALPEGARVSFAGPTAEMIDLRRVTRRDFYLVAALALGVVFVIVVALLRDAVLSGFMVATTVLSYLATLGITHGVFVGLLGAAGLDWKVQVFLFVVLVAVGQDYNIFLAARLAEESRTAGPRAAARTAIIRTGGIISSAGLIMAATLGSLMAGDITLLVQLGFAFALGMLLDTFVIRPLLLPAFAVLTGRTGRPITPAPRPAGIDATPANG